MKLYGIPRTFGRIAEWAIETGVVDVLWVTFVSSLFVAVAYLTWVASPFLGGIFASIIIGALWKDETRSIIMDLMKRRWAEV